MLILKQDIPPHEYCLCCNVCACPKRIREMLG